MYLRVPNVPSIWSARGVAVVSRVGRKVINRIGAYSARKKGALKSATPLAVAALRRAIRYWMST